MNGTASAAKPRKQVSLSARKARSGWIFVLPFVIGMAFIYLPLIYDSIIFSLADKHNIAGVGGYQLEFIGLKNYIYAFTEDANFTKYLVESLKSLGLDIIAIIMLSLFVAVLLNQKMVGRTAFRAIFFIPVVISTGIIAKIAYDNALVQAMSEGNIDMGGGEVVSTTTDFLNAMDVSIMFQNLGFGTALVEPIIGIVGNIYEIVNRSGVQMLIFLAGLQSISPAIYESAQMEGATAWETFWKITFPMISPMILVNAIYTIIDSFTAASNQVMTYIAARENDTKGTAMSWIYFLIVILILAIIGSIISAFVFYQRRSE